MAKELFWVIFLVPSVFRTLLRALDFIKVGSSFYNVILVIEILSVAAFFISFGIMLGHDIFSGKKISLEEFRKEHMRELNQMQSQFFKEYDPLRTQISRMETKLARAQITIEYLKRLLTEEKARKGHSAEQVNQRAIESLS